MAKVDENAAVAELPLEDERLPEKKNRHVIVAINHMQKRRAALIAQMEILAEELEGLDTAIKAIE